MRVRLLGGFEVEGVNERELGSRKGRLLLKVLALARGRPVSIDRLADILWADDQPSRPADQVGVLVSRLRGVFGAERIVRTDAGYSLAADWLDIDELAALAGSSAAAMADRRIGAARVAAHAALALARGPLLPDEDGAWVEGERVTVGAEVTRVRRLAVDAAGADDDHGAAAALAEQALASDPYDEALLRSLMQAHLRAGRPASALAAYARVRERLADDLGVPPSAVTEALHAQALAAADGDVSSPAVRRDPPAGVVGRAAELATLDRALDRVATGRAELILLEGDAGIGKTTLVEAWSRTLGDRAVALFGRCDELGRDLPLQPVIDALAAHLSLIGPERSAALVAGEAATLAPLLGPVAGLPATVVADAEAGRARLFAGLVTVLSRLDETRPAVIVIEDLHLAGASTLAWLAFARRRGHRTLVVVTSRPGGADTLDASERARLGPLDLAAVSDLVGADRADALFRRSGGHPLLLAALASAPDDDLPATLTESVATRVDSLGQPAGAVLRAAAVLGRECDLDLIARVLEVPIVEVLTWLETACQVGLVAEHGSRLGFRHELVREALAAATGSARRAWVHRQAASVLAGRSDSDPLTVAVHARAGGDGALASSSLVAAALAAARRFDLDAAEEHVDAALELAPTPHAYAARARIRMSRLALEPAAADATEAIARGGGAPALEIAGWIAYYRRRYDDARAYADEAAVNASEDAVRMSALALAGRVRHGAGELAEAVEHLSAVGDGPPQVRGVSDVWLAQARNHQGRPAEALATLSRPMVDPDSLAHPWAPLHLRFNRIVALGQLGRAADALRVADELDVLVQREGVIGQRFVAVAANTRGWVLRWTGRAGEADDRNLTAVEVTGGRPGPTADDFAEGHYVALLDLADGCLQRGDWSAAAELATALTPVETWTGNMAWHQRHRLGLVRARLALAAGDAEEAAGLARTVADDAAQRGAGRYRLLAEAIVGLADEAVPADQLDSVVAGLGHCAVLDGWPLIAALASARGSIAWHAEAERLAEVVVANAGDHADDARRFVDATFKACAR